VVISAELDGTASLSKLASQAGTATEVILDEEAGSFVEVDKPLVHSTTAFTVMRSNTSSRSSAVSQLKDLNLGSTAAASSRNNLCSHSMYLKQHTNQVHGE
jgi:hypothetical protein